MDIDKATNAKFLEAFQKIKEAENILLVTHERADGDAVSSLCAMINLCEKLGKRYKAFCPGEPINQYSFLPHTEKIIFDKSAFSNQKSFLDFKDFTLIIALDCGSLERTGLPEEIRGRNLNQFFIEFDHHLKNEKNSDLEIRKPEATATTEILYYFFKANQIKINKNLANCILTGILTDTGNFLYSPTSQKSINIASEMMLYGARFPQIVKNTIHNKSLPAMKVWGLALNNLKINKKYNFAFSVLTLDDIEKFSSEENEDIFDSISGFLSNLYGVKGVLFLREEKGGKLKGSLRSAHPEMDVSRLASKLGGGGHVKASGFVLEGKIEKEGNNFKII
jgi:bifunctional oligoribonuclease and PAP phosphatase NrnA